MAKEELTVSEMEAVTTVFRSYETGLREATILPKVRLRRWIVSLILRQKQRQTDRESTYSGPCWSHEDVGAEPHGAGDSGPDKQDGQGWLYLLS